MAKVYIAWLQWNLINASETQEKLSCEQFYLVQIPFKFNSCAQRTFN